MTEDNHALAWFVRRHDLEEIFWHLTDVSAGEGSCWPWMGRRTSDHYGRVMKDGVLHQAHRLSLELHGIEIPVGYHVDHVCHNTDPTCESTPLGGCLHRLCVNPRHLEPVPVDVNVLRGHGYCAQQARKTHCPAGHPLDGDNLLNSASGFRICRECKRTQVAKRNARVKIAYHARRAEGLPWEEARRMALEDVKVTE